MTRLAIIAAALTAVGAIALLIFAFAGEPVAPAASPSLRSDTGGQDVQPQSMAARPPPPFQPMPLRLRPSSDPGAQVTSAEPHTPGPTPVTLPRIVTSPGISPGPFAATTLEREVPSAPGSESAPMPAGPTWRAFTQIVVIGAARIDIGDSKITLADVVAPEIGSKCHNPGDGGTFACASLATQALRQRIRGRGIECVAEANGVPDSEAARCRLGQSDLALWLIQQGWGSAASEASADYRAAEHEAMCNRRGIWADTATLADCPQR